MSRKSNPSKSKKESYGDKRNNSSILPGLPGYRTRAGRSGYDPIDTGAEEGHMAGTVIQKLFTGQITNRLHLVLLGILGLILVENDRLPSFQGAPDNWHSARFLELVLSIGTPLRGSPISRPFSPVTGTAGVWVAAVG